MKRHEGAAYLNKHLQWKCGQSSCNLMSWTCSLLFALQYAFYRHRGLANPHDLSDITILVVDTRQFTRGVFARDTDVMKAFEDPSTGRSCLTSLYDIRMKKLCFGGEYLSQGEVLIDSGRSCQFSMQKLVDHDLI